MKEIDKIRSQVGMKIKIFYCGVFFSDDIIQNKNKTKKLLVNNLENKSSNKIVQNIDEHLKDIARKLKLQTDRVESILPPYQRVEMKNQSCMFFFYYFNNSSENLFFQFSNYWIINSCYRIELYWPRNVRLSSGKK